MKLTSDTRMMLLATAVTVSSVALVALVIAQNRYDAGVRNSASTSQPIRAAGEASTYLELRNQRRGPNGRVHEFLAEGLREGVPTTQDDVPPRTEQERQLALQKRASRRAYEGAPPTIPHAVTQLELDCVGCHLEGAKIAGKMAPVMSHEVFPSCTQCHVPSASPLPFPSEPGFESSFVGLRRLGESTRAYPGAPPTMPHPQKMRERCDSCHGPTGAQGLRTPHPYQVSCTQCHVGDREAAQRPPQHPMQGVAR